MSDLHDIPGGLRAALAAWEMPQVALARHLGVTQKTTTQWCTGKQTPSLDMLVRIADFLEVGLDELVRPRLGALSSGRQADRRLDSLSQQAQDETDGGYR